jgi:transposase
MDVLLFHRLWHAGASSQEIGRRFGVSTATVYKWAARYKLPTRRRTYTPTKKDPTLEEIAERAAYCRRMREAGTPIGGA